MDDDLPEAVPGKRRWRIPVIWAVPIVAALVAGYLVFRRVHELGPLITIKFRDASGLRIGQTQLEYRGVAIGHVASVGLTPDERYAVVKVRLTASGAGVAREGSVFWVLRPKVGLGSVTGLGTVITGPEIEVSPGHGRPQLAFVGRESAPSTRPGLRIVLVAPRLDTSLQGDVPIYYRGFEVGTTDARALSRNATSVELRAIIRPRYARLVHEDSKFWVTSGVHASFGLFRGLQIHLESLRSLLAGGIEFATPDNPAPRPAPNGSLFPLHAQADPSWLSWSPVLATPHARPPGEDHAKTCSRKRC
ncbi:MAG: MlaD family protein [Betaproteobacteria bacterium]|nr:MlaD family protein [Betaproteobacteria bacterium]